jgi:hypothetical protein
MKREATNEQLRLIDRLFLQDWASNDFLYSYLDILDNFTLVAPDMISLSRVPKIYSLLCVLPKASELRVVYPQWSAKKKKKNQYHHRVDELINTYCRLMLLLN